MELSYSWEAFSCSATQEYPTIFGTGMFITFFARSLHLSLSWASSVYNTSSHSIRFIEYSYPVCVQFSLVIFSYPSHPPWLHNSNYVWRSIQIMKLLIRSFPQWLIIPPSFFQDILFSTLFSNTLSLCPFLNIMTCRLKAGISESERASIASQRLCSHVCVTARSSEWIVAWVTIVNEFTWQRLHRQTVTTEMKNRTVQGDVCCSSRLAGTKGGQMRSRQPEARSKNSDTEVRSSAEKPEVN
jgi:hypothetical protein